MVAIPVESTSLQNGKYVTVYTSTVGFVTEDFSFSKPQETLILKNKGTSNIIYTVGSSTETLKPNDPIKLVGSFTTFSLRAEEGIQSFDVWAVEYANAYLDSKFGEKANKTDSAINVKDQGAKGDGVTDDTLSFKAAWALALTIGRKVYAPYGDYLITDTLSGEAITIFGSGTGETRLIFQNMSGKDCISFTATTKTGVVGEVSDLTFVAKGQNSRNAITTADNSSMYSLYRVRYSFHDLEFRGDVLKTGVPSGSPYDYGWDCYIDLGDCWGAYIDKIDAIGTYDISLNPATQPDQTFLRLSSNGGIMTARVNRVTTSCIKKGFEIGDKCFFMISECDIAHSYDGIFQNASTVYSEGRISDTLVNSQHQCVYLAARSWVAISNVATGRHKNGYDHGLDWYGFRLDDVNKSWLTNLRAQSDRTLTAFTGTHYGFYFKNCDGIAAEGLMPGSGLTYPVYSDATAGATFNGTNFQIDTTSLYAWYFTNNSRYIKIGTYENHTAVPNYFADGTVTKANIQIVATAAMP